VVGAGALFGKVFECTVACCFFAALCGFSFFLRLTLATYVKRYCVHWGSLYSFSDALPSGPRVSDVRAAAQISLSGVRCLIGWDLCVPSGIQIQLFDRQDGMPQSKLL